MTDKRFEQIKSALSLLLTVGEFTEFTKQLVARTINPTDYYLDRLVMYDLDLSIRSTNALKNLGITTLRELISHTPSQLLKSPSLGRKSLNEIIEVLSELEPPLTLAKG
jgi:DNA-directed RNA polymerase subunit alpha